MGIDMVKVEVIENKRKVTIAKDFNFLAEANEHQITVGYKQYVPFYEPMFSIDRKRLPQLIEVLSALQKALSQATDQEGT